METTATTTPETPKESKKTKFIVWAIILLLFCGLAYTWTKRAPEESAIPTIDTTTTVKDIVLKKDSTTAVKTDSTKTK